MSKIKILSHVFENGMIRVTTDNPDRPDFVYPDDKFYTKAALLAEIEKSVEQEEKRKGKKKEKKDKLEEDLNV